MRLGTVKQAAEILAIPREQAYVLARRGDLPAVKLGAEPRAAVRINLDALERWLETGGPMPWRPA